jgi:hypothetical protein
MELVHNGNLSVAENLYVHGDPDFKYRYEAVLVCDGKTFRSFEFPL